MNRKPRFPTSIRAWREYRGLTLRALAAQLFDDDGRPLISYASLGRIERGLQPYSQPVLEALAEALETIPGNLLFDTDPASHEAGHLVWRDATPAQRYVWTRMMMAMLDAQAEIVAKGEEAISTYARDAKNNQSGS